MAAEILRARLSGCSGEFLFGLVDLAGVEVGDLGQVGEAVDDDPGPLAGELTGSAFGGQHGIQRWLRFAGHRGAGVRASASRTRRRASPWEICRLAASMVWVLRYINRMGMSCRSQVDDRLVDVAGFVADGLEPARERHRGQRVMAG